MRKRNLVVHQPPLHHLQLSSLALVQRHHHRRHLPRHAPRVVDHRTPQRPRIPPSRIRRLVPKRHDNADRRPEQCQRNILYAVTTARSYTSRISSGLPTYVSILATCRSCGTIMRSPHRSSPPETPARHPPRSSPRPCQCHTPNPKSSAPPWPSLPPPMDASADAASAAAHSPPSAAASNR